LRGAHTNRIIRAKFSILGCLAFKTYANSRVQALDVVESEKGPQSGLFNFLIYIKNRAAYN
jgi:hypothetical protein